MRIQVMKRVIFLCEAEQKKRDKKEKDLKKDVCAHV